MLAFKKMYVEIYNQIFSRDVDGAAFGNNLLVLVS